MPLAVLWSATRADAGGKAQPCGARPPEATELGVRHAARAVLFLGLRQPDLPWIFLPHKEKLFLVYMTLMYLNLSKYKSLSLMPFELL